MPAGLYFLRNFRAYATPPPKASWAEFSAPEGHFIIFANLGTIAFNEEFTNEELERRMKGLGWIRSKKKRQRKNPDTEEV